MSLALTRKSRELTLEQMAAELGLRSKGYLSRLETGGAAGGAYAPLRLALQIERWSAGEVPAESLLSPEDAQLLREAIAAGRSPALEGVAA